MWKQYSRISPLLFHNQLLTSENISQQVRTTFILKRRMAPQLHKKGKEPRRFQSKHYIYDLVQDTNCVRLPDLSVILTTYVEGIGTKGQQVSVRPNLAYEKLLLPGLAVYASPENLEKYKRYKATDDTVQYSSPNVPMMIKVLSNMSLSVIMNKDIPWTLKPRHVKMSLRRCGYHVPEEAITIPSRPIQGPNMEIEGKQFSVCVTINKKEKVELQCRIHHWSTSIVDRLPYDFEYWKKPMEPIFTDEKEST